MPYRSRASIQDLPVETIVALTRDPEHYGKMIEGIQQERAEASVAEQKATSERDAADKALKKLEQERALYQNERQSHEEQVARDNKNFADTAERLSAERAAQQERSKSLDEEGLRLGERATNLEELGKSLDKRGVELGQQAEALAKEREALAAKEEELAAREDKLAQRKRVLKDMYDTTDI
jgi:uncharacterized protein (DUF3084 family)